MTANYLAPWTRVEHFAENLVGEAQREIGLGHPLWMKRLRAIAQRTDNDDVLFEVFEDSYSYALVHLTWRGAPSGLPDDPPVSLFLTLDEWVCQVMLPDHRNYVEV
jgi:hypothetical protein